MEGSNDTELDSGNVAILSIKEKIVRAAVLSVMLLVGLVLNLVVILYTICHPKSLKQSAIILLLASSVVNVTILLSHIPFQITNSFTEEWLLGNSTEARIFCQINALFTGSTEATNFVLALISWSVDRFFYLVKPLVHKKYFQPWLPSLMLAIVFVILLAEAVVDLLYNEAGYMYNPKINICLPLQNANIISITTIGIILSAFPVVVIVVTTLWTFLSTHNFIKSDHQRRVDAIGSREEEARDIEDNLYTKRIKKLFGMFSLLLISQLMSVMPLVLAIILGNIIGSHILPSAYLFITAIFIYLGCITNPIIQSYFRQDLSEFFKNNCGNIMGRCKH